MVDVGLIGYAAGRTIHAPLITEAGGRLAAVVTRDPERAEAARREHPGIAVVPDVPSLLQVDPLDLVVVVSPTGLHEEHAAAVIDAGLPLVVDKPVAPTAERAEAVVRRADAAGVPLVPFHNRRWDLVHQTARALVRGGRLGEVQHVESAWTRWRPAPERRWRETASAAEGGGILLDLGTHLVDGVLDLAGPGRCAHAAIAARLSPADDDCVLTLTHVSGALSRVHVSSTSPLHRRTLRVIGSEAAYEHVWDESDETGADGFGWIVCGDEREPAPAPEWAAPFYAQLFRAIAAEGAGPLPVAAGDAVAVARVLDDARSLDQAARRDR